MKFARFVRLTAILLIPALLCNHLAFAAKMPADSNAVKARLEARGVGQGVRVTLTDNTEAKGLIVSIGDHSFVVKPKGAAPPREIPYTQVTGVHKDKMGTGTKVVIVVAIAGAAIGIATAILVHKVDNSLKGPVL